MDNELTLMPRSDLHAN